MATYGAYVHMTARPAQRPARRPSQEWTFDALYRAQYARMVALARLMTGPLSPSEEIVQEAFVQLYRNWSSVDYPLAYVRIAVVNGCRSHGRRRAVQRRHPLPDHEPVVVDTTAIAVRDALQALTPRQRAAVVLRYFEDLPEREIATALGCRPGTVKSLLSRSMVRLKGLLHD